MLSAGYFESTYVTQDVSKAYTQCRMFAKNLNNSGCFKSMYVVQNIPKAYA
jgi:hypothetical protein